MSRLVLTRREGEAIRLRVNGPCDIFVVLHECSGQRRAQLLIESPAELVDIRRTEHLNEGRRVPAAS